MTRSLALANMLKTEFNCVFATRFADENLKISIEKECDQVVILDENEHEREFLSLLAGDETVVLDNYFFDSDFQRSVGNKGSKVVAIDDLHDRQFNADAIINHAPLVERSCYGAMPETEFWLGLDYLLLRPEFLNYAGKKRDPYKKETVFLCFGGSDYNNYTEKLFKALAGVDDVKHINILLGRGYLYKTQLLELISESDPRRISIYEDLSPADIIRLVENSDFAIVPSSTILFELMRLGIPTISGYYIENQMDIYHGFLQLNMISGMGDFREIYDYARVLERCIKEADFNALMANQQTIISRTPKENYLKAFKCL